MRGGGGRRSREEKGRRGREEKRKERIEKTRVGTQGLWEGTGDAVRKEGVPRHLVKVCRGGPWGVLVKSCSGLGPGQVPRLKLGGAEPEQRVKPLTLGLRKWF